MIFLCPNGILTATLVYILVLQHEPTMMRLLGALGHSTGSSLAMLLGDSAGAGTATELGDPASIPDATFQLLTTLTKKASNRTLVLNPLYQYLSSCKNHYLTNLRVKVGAVLNIHISCTFQRLDKENWIVNWASCNYLNLFSGIS